MTLLIVLGIGYLSAGLSIGLLHVLYLLPSMQKYMISDDPHRNADPKQMRIGLAFSSTGAMALITGGCYLFQDSLFHMRDIPWYIMLLEAVAVVLIYDFAYYFLHRYPFHEWKLLRRVHSIHHAARNPRTIDSLLLHPLETVLGIALLFGAILLVGGVHFWTFAPIFVVYTTLNIFNHAGIAVPHFPFKTIGTLAIKHDKHHHSMLSGNYASVTPLPDMIFGTVE